MQPFPPLQHPIIQSPMAGGPSTPALTAAVSNAGGLGFLAAGYKPLEAVRADLRSAKQQTSRPFGVNLFVPAAGDRRPADPEAVRRYAKALQVEADRYGVQLGQAHFDDDGWSDKLSLVLEEQVPVVSFTFGCPTRDVVERLHARGIAVWVTITEVEEAIVAQHAGADALVVQGFEAGGHRGTFEDRDGGGEVGLLSLLCLCSRSVSLPLVAAGGIADGAGVAAVLAAGARAAQVGTAFMRCPEAGTSPPHRAALTAAGRTALTRAFSGRRARGIINRFMIEHSSQAPAAYPDIAHVTQPLRAAAGAAGDADGINLWAGQAYALGEDRPAAELVRQWSADAVLSLESALSRLRTE